MGIIRTVKDHFLDIDFSNISFWLIDAYHLNRELTSEELKNEISMDILKKIEKQVNSKFKSYDIEEYFISSDPFYGVDEITSFLRFSPMSVKIFGVDAELYIRINPCSIKGSERSDPKIIIIIDQKLDFHQQYTSHFFEEAKRISNGICNLLNKIFYQLDQNNLYFYSVTIHSVGCESQIAKYLIKSSRNKDEYLSLLQSNRDVRKLNDYMNQWGETSFDFCHSGWAVWDIRDNEKNLNSLGVIGMCSKQNELIFTWEKIPGNDNIKLIEFLKQNFGIDWAKSAIIEKIDADMTIKISSGKNDLTLKLNDKKTKLNLQIDDVRTNEFVAKTENSKLNIYQKDNLTNIITLSNGYMEQTHSLNRAVAIPIICELRLSVED